MNKRTVMVFLVVLAAAFAADGLPNCGQGGSGQVRCGMACLYSQELGAGTGGGYCGGTNSSETGYCLAETRPTEWDDVFVFACHEGAYDACCDRLNPY